MEPIQVSSYKEITDVIGQYPNSPDNPFYYRGLRKGYLITPSIAYPDSALRLKTQQAYTDYELATITAFHNHLREGFGITDHEHNDWELWFLARHFSLKSRLTDFTKDFSVASQFAIEMSGNSPCQVYCLNTEGITRRNQNELGDPFTHEELCLIQPSLRYRETMARIGVSRMFIQSGKFLSQPLATVERPLVEQIASKYWSIFEIQPEHFDRIKTEVGKAFDVDMAKPLVVAHAIDGICAHINTSHLPN